MQTIAKIIQRNIHKKELQSSKGLPEFVPDLSIINNNNNNKRKMMKSILKSTPNKPLPEKSIQSNVSLMAIDDEETESSDNMNHEEEERAMDALVYTKLGTGFAGEMLKRIRYSRENSDCSYYYFCFDLLKVVHAEVIMDCITSSMSNLDSNTDWKQISK